MPLGDQHHADMGLRTHTQLTTPLIMVPIYSIGREGKKEGREDEPEAHDESITDEMFATVVSATCFTHPSRRPRRSRLDDFLHSLEVVTIVVQHSRVQDPLHQIVGVTCNNTHDAVSSIIIDQSIIRFERTSEL